MKVKISRIVQTDYFLFVSAEDRNKTDEKIIENTLKRFFNDSYGPSKNTVKINAEIEN